MKKFICILNILLLLLIPTTLFLAKEEEKICYETDTKSSLKMINTTVFIDRSNKKREEEDEKRRKEQEEARVLALKQEEERKKEEQIKSSAIKKTEVVTTTTTVEQVSSLETKNDSDTTVGNTTTVTVGTSEQAYVGYKFSGSMSAYGRDCCSSDPNKWGITASGFNIFTNGMYYNDPEYGRVRIIAASRNDFYLYSVIKINDPLDGIYNAIVLDRGDSNIGIGRRFVFDLVVESQEWARINYGVHKNVAFEVLRIGRA